MIDLPQELNHQLPSFYQEIAEQDATIATGSSKLFEYDAQTNIVTLSADFKQLIHTLIEIKELDPRAKTAKNLKELNDIFQQPQGVEGGLLRKPGSERWHIFDSASLIQNKEVLNTLFRSLGFLDKKELHAEVEVDLAVVFGAKLPRMKSRIIHTIDHLSSRVNVSGNVFLLGTARKLTGDEKKEITALLEEIDDLAKKSLWKKTFEEEALCTEANAMKCLWEILAPSTLKKEYQGRVLTTNSTKIGASYFDTQGNRPTTESTIEDFLNHFDSVSPQKVFAFIENPYARLADQLRWTTLSNKRGASKEEFLQRQKNTTFYFSYGAAKDNLRLCLILDEIARTLYSIISMEKYINSLSIEENNS